MLDDLRNSVNDSYEEELAEEERIQELKRSRPRKPFLGMTPLQRFVLAVIFFLMVAVLGFILLVLSQRIMPPIG
jgi:cell division septal protein FtsQ